MQQFTRNKVTSPVFFLNLMQGLADRSKEQRDKEVQDLTVSHLRLRVKTYSLSWELPKK